MEENFPDRIDSKFRYVLLASARAEQLMRGARTQLEAAGGKRTTIAMHEVTDDRIEWGYGPSPTLADEEMILTPAEEPTEEAAAEEEEVH